MMSKDAWIAALLSVSMSCADAAAERQREVVAAKSGSLNGWLRGFVFAAIEPEMLGPESRVHEGFHHFALQSA
jgi:hypothetical protein